MSENTPSDVDAAAGADAQPQFALHRLYVKDLSLEVPRAPDVFRTQWQPKVKMDLNTRSNRVEADTYEVVLTISVEARDAEDRIGFIVEVQQAGLFRAAGLDAAQLHHTLGSYCPNLLFPYAREAVDSMVLRGGFPALLLAPVNFDALYAEALKQQQGQTPGAGAPAAQDPVQH
ncbi:MAG: protein-export chaperone SecB [Pseudomonadales bacterium]|jgi:preprotein translocase subunit SecB|nr:protein-export chaperone SecB [Pseudomonadales bacterium]